MNDLKHLARPGTEIAVRAHPRASRNAVVTDGAAIRVYVTVAPEGGKANEAVRKLLAAELGLAKTRLVLIRGETSREKVFRVAE